MDLIQDFAGKPVKIAFVGSCITEGFGLINPKEERFSKLFCDWFSEKFAGSTPIEMNLGYPRNSSVHVNVWFSDEIIERQPDILFLEIAGEDWHMGSETGASWLEGAIRKIRTNLPKTFIFNVYPYGGFLTRHYKGIERHQLDKWYRPIMNHYGIPTIDAGQYIWKGDFIGKWKIDDLMQDARWHPNKFGHASYAKALTDFIEENIFSIEHKSIPSELGKPIIEGQIGKFDNTLGWSDFPWTDYGDRKFTLKKNTQKGTPLFGIFYGTIFGLYWLSTNSSGKVIVSIDGGENGTWIIDLWDKNYTQSEGLNGVIFADNLKNDSHTFSIIPFSGHNDKSLGEDISIAYYFTGVKLE